MRPRPGRYVLLQYVLNPILSRSGLSLALSLFFCVRTGVIAAGDQFDGHIEHGEI